jgi:uncharacterized protein YdeI (YjbR/CyaY-like superfamily)
MAKKKSGRPVHFETAEAFRAWLAKNHANTEELWIGFYKKSTKKRGTTYAEALDEALSYGWIDGVRYSVNEMSYKIRFTPRKPKSIWSLVNVRHAERLKKAGKMAEPGLKVYEAREQRRTGIYAFEQKRAGLSEKYKKIVRANPAAWKFFSSQAPWYQRTAGFWVSSAKQEVTRQRRLEELMADSEKGRRINQLNYPKTKRA